MAMTSPSNRSSTPSGVGSNGGGAPAAGGAAGKAAQGGLATRRNLILAGAGALVVVLAVAAFLIRKKMNEPPRLNEPSATLAKYGATPAFDKLPLVEQKKFMIELDGRKDDLKAAYEAGTINEAEYRTAKELMWFGEELDRMETYYSLPPGSREAFLQKEAAKAEKKDAEKRAKESASGRGGRRDDTTTSGGRPKVERSEATEKTRPMGWPAEERQRWNEYRQKYGDLRKQIEEARKAREAASTKPAG